MSIFRASYKRRDGTRAQTTVFYVEFRDHVGRRRVFPAFAGEIETRDLNRRLVQLAADRVAGKRMTPEDRDWVRGLPPKLRLRLGDAGLVDPELVASLRPLSELVDAWREHLKAKGTSERQWRQVTARALTVLTGAGAGFLREIDATRMEQFLRREREHGINIRTSNFHLQGARQFVRWAVRMGYLAEDPLRSILPLNPSLDRRRERRALTYAEIRTLLNATEKGPPRDCITGEPAEDGMSGHERALVYRLAVETGLRRNETKTLLVADLELSDIDVAVLRVRPANAKNRRDAVLPLRPETAKILATFVDGRPTDSRVFSCGNDWRSAAVLRADLAAAGIAYADATGKVVDFHALRTTFGTSLARSGVALQVAQRLMRHSSPSLTSNIYTVLGREDERAAIAALPDFGRRAKGPNGRPSPRAADAVDGSRLRDVPLLLDAGAAATLLGMSRRALYCCDRRGDVPRALHVGTHRRWSRPELTRWVRAGCPPRAAWESRAAPRSNPPLGADDASPTVAL